MTTKKIQKCPFCGQKVNLPVGKQGYIICPDCDKRFFADTRIEDADFEVQGGTKTTQVDITDVDIAELVKQFEGRKYGELVLLHVKEQNIQQLILSLKGLTDELRVELQAEIPNIIDIFNSVSGNELFYSTDCGEKLSEIVDVTKGYFNKQFNLLLTQDEAFNIFNIVTLNFAYACHKHPQTKAAIQKAIGKGFLGRLFS